MGYRALGGFAILLTGVVFLGYFAMTPYRPPLPQYFSAVILAIFFILLAWKVSYEYERQESTKPRGPASFFATGLFGTIGFFIVFWVLPNLLSPLGVMFFGGILVFGCARFLKRLKLKGCDDIRRFALASGALLFLIFLAPLQELDKTRPDNPQGMGLVGLAFLIGLLLLGWRVKRRTQTSKQEQLLG